MWTRFFIACLTIRLTIFITVQLSFFPLQRLLILLLSSSHLLAIAAPLMVPRLLYFSVKVDLSKIVSGLTKDSLLFLIIILVAILFMLGATYFASLSLSEHIIQALGRWSSQAWCYDFLLFFLSFTFTTEQYMICCKAAFFLLLLIFFCFLFLLLLHTTCSTCVLYFPFVFCNTWTTHNVHAVSSCSTYLSLYINH